MFLTYNIRGGDFASAGNISSSLKKILRELNTDHSIAKRIVIALYEAEVNVVAHAWSGTVYIELDSQRIKMSIEDEGPGIDDIEKAMQEGYSTASSSVREMGFGAGMGLSNMKKNSDTMNITSKPGKGTRVELITFLKAVSQTEKRELKEAKNESI